MFAREVLSFLFSFNSFFVIIVVIIFYQYHRFYVYYSFRILRAVVYMCSWENDVSLCVQRANGLYSIEAYSVANFLVRFIFLYQILIALIFSLSILKSCVFFLVLLFLL